MWRRPCRGAIELTLAVTLGEGRGSAGLPDRGLIVKARAPNAGERLQTDVIRHYCATPPPG